jgi:hypothetical protein
LNRESFIIFLFQKYFILLCFIISIATGASLIVEQAEFSRIIMLTIAFFCFPLNVCFNATYTYCLVAVFFFLFLTQVGSALGIPYTDVFRDSFYPIEDNVWSSNNIEGIESLNDNRYAGIYYNPNIMGQSMVLLYVIIAKCLNDLNDFKLKIILTFLFFVSILLTGSRTSIFVFFIMLFFQFKSFFKFSFIIPFASIALLFILFNMDSISIYLDNFRSFNVASLYGEKLSSGTAKLDIFLTWFNEILNGTWSNSIQFIFGVGVILQQFDFDIGYILQVFGLFGFIAIFMFFRKIYMITPRKNRFIFFIFLISIGATVIVNFRFSILAIIILSMYQNSNEIIAENE